MPMTEYDGNVEIITNIGTTPDERGLSTDEFKAKFDEGLKAFVTWFNDTHKTEFDAHLAEKATEEDLGHVIVDGDTITVDENGVISGGGKFVAGSFTRSTTTASGTQQITGLGFKPRFIIFLATVNNIASRMSVGITDGTDGGCITDVNAGTGTANAYAASVQNIFMRQGEASTHSYYGSVQSMDDDGFTINWTKGATAVDGETITVRYLAGR